MTRTWPALVALGALLTTGCGSAATDRSAPERPRPAPEQGREQGDDAREKAEKRDDRRHQPTPARERRTVARNAAPTEAPADPFFGRADADAHLLPAEALGSRWSTSGTADEDGRLASDCQAASLYDIGAQAARLRDYAGPRGQAVQAVAEFADRRSAWRAQQVLFAWREKCADRLRTRDAALGTVRHGVWVSVVDISGVRRPGRRLHAFLDDVRASFG